MDHICWAVAETATPNKVGFPRVSRSSRRSRHMSPALAAESHTLAVVRRAKNFLNRSTRDVHPFSRNQGRSSKDLQFSISTHRRQFSIVMSCHKLLSHQSPIGPSISGSRSRFSVNLQAAGTAARVPRMKCFKVWICIVGRPCPCFSNKAARLDMMAQRLCCADLILELRITTLQKPRPSPTLTS